jgi:hypothetical protein
VQNVTLWVQAGAVAGQSPGSIGASFWRGWLGDWLGETLFRDPGCTDGAVAVVEEPAVVKRIWNTVAAAGNRLLFTAAPADAGRPRQLERELEEARRLGRWLSDDEREALAEADQRAVQRQLEQQRQRRSLLLLVGVCLLLPPFWPLALGLIAYLLFPHTTRKVTIVLAALAALGVLALVVGVIALLVLLILH